MFDWEEVVMIGLLGLLTVVLLVIGIALLFGAVVLFSYLATGSTECAVYTCIQGTGEVTVIGR